MSSQAAVFLDRDGVLIEDVHLLARGQDLHILPRVPEALALLSDAGFTLVVVSNQPVVARGLIDIEGVREINRKLGQELEALGAPPIRKWSFCPHHPEADLLVFRLNCQRRKPQPGMILEAAAELELDLNRSFLVGDRLSDISAGTAAGCRTVQVLSGQHDAPPISGAEQPGTRPDAVVDGLWEAAEFILGHRS